ncbi:MAG: MarR family winged helix-turn-helix transcriptional regulator [Geminicoccaceae bacterium]
MPSPCYCAVLRGAARKVTALYDEALAPVGLTLAQFRLLRLVERAGDPPSLTELGRVAELDRSTIGRNVRLLQRLGLVRVVPGGDQREATVALEEAGRRALHKATPLWDGAQRRIEAALGPDAAARLRSLLQSL